VLAGALVAIPASGSDEAHQLSADAQNQSELTLEEAQHEAIRHSHELALARFDFEEAQTDVDAARAARRPSIDSQITASYMTDPGEGIAIERGELGTVPTPDATFPEPFPDTDIELMPDPESTFYQLQASLEQPLFTWGKLRDGVAAAEIGREIARIELQDTRSELEADVRNAYFGVAVADQSVEVLSELEDMFETIAADRERAYEEGARPRQEVLEAEQQVAQTRSARVSAEQAQMSARRSLAYLIGRELGEDEELTTAPRTDVPELDADELEQQAREHSPEREVIRKRIEQAQIAERIEERTDSPWRPDLALSVQLETGGQRFPGLQRNWSDTWDTNVTITLAGRLSLYDGGAQRAARRSAEIDRARARTGLDQFDESLPIQVADAAQQLRVAEAQLGESRADLELAREREKNAEVSYENDMITREELLMARTGALSAELELTRAELTVEQALVELEQLIGRTLVTR